MFTKARYLRGQTKNSLLFLNYYEIINQLISIFSISIRAIPYMFEQNSSTNFQNFILSYCNRKNPIILDLT